MDPNLIDLTKKVESILDLRKIADVKAQVCLAIDASGSMTGLYGNGTVQKTVNRVSAVAVKFDDNQELDVFVFSNGVREAAAARPEMFGTYVDKHIIKAGLAEFGGTNYAPFIHEVVKKYFTASVISSVTEAATGIFGALKGLFASKPAAPAQQPTTGAKSASGLPIFCIVVTDGENYDQSETTALLKAMQDKNVYFQFVGIGRENFSYLKRTADALPNVGFYALENLESVKDMELYKNLLSEEFAAWVKKF